MPKEIKVMCPLGNGECPETCPNHEAAKKFNEELGNEFDPASSRLAILFGNAFDRNIGITDIANAIDGCIKEKKTFKD